MTNSLKRLLHSGVLELTREKVKYIETNIIVQLQTVMLLKLKFMRVQRLVCTLELILLIKIERTTSLDLGNMICRMQKTLNKSMLLNIRWELEVEQNLVVEKKLSISLVQELTKAQLISKRLLPNSALVPLKDLIKLIERVLLQALQSIMFLHN